MDRMKVKTDHFVEMLAHDFLPESRRKLFGYGIGPEEIV